MTALGLACMLLAVILRLGSDKNTTDFQVFLFFAGMAVFVIGILIYIWRILP